MHALGAAKGSVAHGRVTWLLVAGVALGLCACKADIPDGRFACDDERGCPSGFICRADGEDPTLYCFASDGARDAGTGGDGELDGGPADGGGGANADAALDGGAAGDGAHSVVLRGAGFWSGGEARGVDRYRLHDDGFDRGVPMCSADRKFCVTGGFSP